MIATTVKKAFNATILIMKVTSKQVYIREVTAEQETETYQVIDQTVLHYKYFQKSPSENSTITRVLR